MFLNSELVLEELHEHAKASRAKLSKQKLQKAGIVSENSYTLREEFTTLNVSKQVWRKICETLI